VSVQILRTATERLPAVLELEAAAQSGSLRRAVLELEAAKKQLEALIDVSGERGTAASPVGATRCVLSKFEDATSQHGSSRPEECMTDEGDGLDEHQLALKAAMVNAPDVEALKAALAEARAAKLPEGLLAPFETQVEAGESVFHALNQAVAARDWKAVRTALVVGRQSRLSEQQVAPAEAALAQSDALRADLQRVCQELQASAIPAGERNATTPDNRPVAIATEELRRLLAAGHDLGLEPEQLAMYEDALEHETQKQQTRQELWNVLTEVQTLDPHSAELDALVEAKLQLQAAVSSALLGGLSEDEVAAAELKRRRIHNAVEDRKGAVRVFCRVRPLSTAEVAAGEREVVRCKELCSVEIESIQPGSFEGKGFEMFGFDACWSPGTQEDVFDGVRDLVQSVVDGYNATLFAYGQTGAGKTYTLYGPGSSNGGSLSSRGGSSQGQRRRLPERMSSCPAAAAETLRPSLPAVPSLSKTAQGNLQADQTPGDKHSTAELRGICPRAAEELFRILERDDPRYSFSVTLSMVELYCQRFIDLLELGIDKPLKIRTSHDGEVYLENLSEQEVCSADHVNQLMTAGLRERHFRDTRMNLESSRSHVLFIMKVKRTNRERGCITRGKMLLVDLAGSERVKRSDVSGVGLKEAIEVNRSLTALADVIAALARGEKHVPYRNHELTQVMQDSLGGSAKALMFTNLSPCESNREETLTSLKFAQRVKGAVRTPANCGRLSVDSVVARLSSARQPATLWSAAGSHRCPAGTTASRHSNPRSANRTPVVTPVVTPGQTPAQTPAPPWAPLIRTPAS
jgi:hypothetical protein